MKQIENWRHTQCGDSRSSNGPDRLELGNTTDNILTPLQILSGNSIENQPTMVSYREHAERYRLTRGKRHPINAALEERGKDATSQKKVLCPKAPERSARRDYHATREDQTNPGPFRTSPSAAYGQSTSELASQRCTWELHSADSRAECHPPPGTLYGNRLIPASRRRRERRQVHGRYLLASLAS